LASLRGLTAESLPFSIHFGLRDCTRLDQPFDAPFAKIIAVGAHTILQASGLKTPLAAKPPVIFGTFALSGFRRADGEK